MFKGKLDLTPASEFLANLMKPKAPPLIGVDISSSSVKMVEIAAAGKGRYRLDRYTVEPLTKDAVVDGNIMNLEEVGEAVKRGWKKMNTRVRNLALALPSAAVITKKIVMAENATIMISPAMIRPATPDSSARRRFIPLANILINPIDPFTSRRSPSSPALSLHHFATPVMECLPRISLTHSPALRNRC